MSVNPTTRRIVVLVALAGLLLATVIAPLFSR